MKYTIKNKTTGQTPTRATDMDYKGLLDMVNTFVSFNRPSLLESTDKQKIAYYNKHSFYNIVEL